MKTLKVSLAIGQLVSRDGFAYRDEGQRAKPLGSRMMKVTAFPLAAKRLGDDVRGLQAQGQEELEALLPSVPVLRKVEGPERAFKGEL